MVVHRVIELEFVEAEWSERKLRFVSTFADNKQFYRSLVRLTVENSIATAGFGGRPRGRAAEESNSQSLEFSQIRSTFNSNASKRNLSCSHKTEETKAKWKSMREATKLQTVRRNENQLRSKKEKEGRGER